MIEISYKLNYGNTLAMWDHSIDKMVCHIDFLWKHHIYKGEKADCNQSNHWQSLTIIDNLWQSLAIIGNHWQSLTIFGNHWQSFAIIRNLWQSLKIFDNQ
jgi:hypothetical protein